jgi:hypothetical protein
MDAGALGKNRKAVRRVTDHTSCAPRAVYGLSVRPRSIFAGGAAGIDAMRLTIDRHLGDADLAKSKLFSGWRRQFQFWRVIAISAVARTGRELLCFERSQCPCCG